MTKMKGVKLITGAEKRRLRRELKQMWSTVPPQALDRARELAGVQAGKEDEFRIALVREQEGVQFIDYRVGINLRAGLTDGRVNGEKAKLLKVQLQCGERAWQIDDGIYAKRFQRSEQLKEWLASIEKHVLLHLLERLRDICVLVWDEAVAKASYDHGVQKIDLTALAKAHINELRKDKSKALSIPRGARKGSKHSKVNMSKQQVEIDLAHFIREEGENVTRAQAVARFRLRNPRALDRVLKRYGKPSWRPFKSEVLTGKIKAH